MDSIYKFNNNIKNLCQQPIAHQGNKGFEVELNF